MGIRLKILLILGLALLATLASNSWLYLQDQKARQLQQAQQQHQDISGLLGTILAHGVAAGDEQTLQQLLDDLMTKKDIIYLKITNDEKGFMAERGDADTQDGYLSEHPLHYKNRLIGYFTLGTKYRTLPNDPLSWLNGLPLKQAGIILLITLGEFIALSYFIVRPLRSMVKSVRTSAQQAYNHVEEIPYTSDDEFGLVALEFNRMSQKLNETNQQLKLKVDAADRKLLKTNKRLVEQSVELTRINEELHTLSITDALTNVYNRRYFDDQLSNEVEVTNRYGEPTSLLLIDLDHFKIINDVYGHYAGDIVLQKVAQTLRANIRKTDLLCRVGGEEFAVICKHTGKENAINLSEKLRQSIEKLEIQLDQETIRLTTSIGITTIPDTDKAISKDYFYLCADRALYQSKASGRNRVTHSHHINLEAIRLITDTVV